jgi:hypothetical protein
LEATDEKCGIKREVGMKSRISTIVAGLFFVLAGQAGLTAAATGTSGASASGARRGT